MPLMPYGEMVVLAQTVVAASVLMLAAATAAWKSAHIFASRNLKDKEPIPSDFEDDKYWPTAQ